MLTAPKFPEDFKVLYADGGGSYWHWHPDAPADYEGTWSATEDPPQWSGGLMIGNEEYASVDRSEPGLWIVSWEFGPDLGDGPFERCHNDDAAINAAIQVVIEEVNRQSAFA